MGKIWKKRGILYQFGQIIVVLIFFLILLFFQVYYKVELGF